MYAIRRIIVPQHQIDAVSQALIARLEKGGGGRPGAGRRKNGFPANNEQRADVQEKVDQLGPQAAVLASAEKADLQAAGAFYLPTLALCPQPDETSAVHATEAFGPVATLMPYRHADHAMQLARGAAVAWPTLVTADPALARQFISGAARAHGRIQILNEESAKESTGHGSPLPARARRVLDAGGGESCGLRAVKHYMQRTAIQGSSDHAGRHRQTMGTRRDGA